MGFSARADFRVTNFVSAEMKYSRITPIRGTEIRPLGNRRAKHIQIIKYNADTYACRYYHTDVATFHRDGRIVYQTNGYATVSTAAIMTALMPARYYTYKLTNHIQAFNPDTNMYYIVESGFTINTETGEVSGIRTPTKQLVDRERTKEKRAVVMPFLQFAQGIMQVFNMDVPFEAEKRHDNHRLRYQFLDDPTKVSEEKYLDLLSAFAYASSWSGTHSDSFAQIKSKIYRNFTEYREVELPIGSLQK
jgi:hypothetical protein